MDSKLTQDWGRGANNIAPADHLPDGFARELVNVDPLPGGALSQRIGYEIAYTPIGVLRGALELGDKLLLADGASLVEYDTRTQSSRVLRTIVGSGAFAGDVFNEELYFCTATECLRYDGQTVRAWGVPDVGRQPDVTPSDGGGLRAGHYQVALVWADADGREGGTDKPLIVSVPANGKLTVAIPAPPAGYTANLYVGSYEGKTLYLQATGLDAGSFVVGLVRDDTRHCDSILRHAPQPGDSVVAHNSVLAIARDGLVQLTEPFRPHLVNRVTGFFQFAAPVGVLLSINQTLLVGADKTYALNAVETDAATPRTVLDFPPVKGTAVKLPDGNGAFMTRYGLALFDGQAVNLVNRASYVPAQAEAGAAGYVEHNGNPLVVTSLRGKQRINPLAAADFFIGEIKQ